MERGLRFAELPSGVVLGGEVRGQVVLPAHLDEITISLVFETSGSCDSERATLRQSVARRDGGEGSAGFVIEAPAWPPTYRGHLFDGRWFVEARSGTEVARQELVVTSDPGPPAVRVLQRQRAPGSGYARRLRQLVILSLLLLACVMAVVVGLRRGDGWWALGLVLGLLLLLPTIGTGLGVLAARAAGEFTVSAEPVAGAVAVRARLGDPSRVTSVTATLVGRERAQRFAGLDNREQHEQVIHEQAVAMASDGSGGFTATVPVPPYPAAPYTVSHSTAQVGWSVQVTAAITGAPDQTRTLPLLLQPATGPGATVETRWTAG